MRQILLLRIWINYLTIDDLSDMIDEDFDALTHCMEILGQQMHNRNKSKKGKK